MKEFKFPRMQEVSLEAVAFPVEWVSGDRVTEALEMDADLMGSSGTWHARNERPTIPRGEKLVVGHRISSRWGAARSHLLPLDRVASDRQINGSLGVAWAPPDDGQIGFLHQAVGKGS